MNAPSTAPLVPDLPPSVWTEVVRGAVSLAAVVVGGAITLFVAYLTFRRQAAQAEKAEAERHRKEGVRERLQLQREAYGEYLRLMTKHQASTGTLMEGVIAKIERRKQEEAVAHQDAITLFGKLVLAFGGREFAIQAADTVQMMSAVRDQPANGLLVSGPLANEVTDRMMLAIAATEAALGLPAVALVPPPIVSPEDYAKQRNRAGIRSAVEGVHLSKEKLDALFAAVDAEREARKADDGTKS